LSTAERPRGPGLVRAFLRGRFFRFALIGTAGLVVSIAAVHLAADLFGLDLYSAGVFAFVVAVTFTFFCNRLITFRDAAREPVLRQWAHFVVSQLGGQAVNYAVYAATITLWPLARDYPSIAVAFGSIAGLAVNFTAASKLVFKADRG